MLANIAQNATSSLTAYAATSLRGEDVLGFLNNILTCEVENLSEGQVTYGALLNPQGKILHDLFVVVCRDGADLYSSLDQRDALIAKLKLYRLRAKIVIFGSDDPAAFVDPRHVDLTTHNRFDLGIANASEIGSAKLFPHEANLDLLKGVSFDKGCYVGQEVVSRMKHRGLVRSRILPVQFDTDQYADEIRVGDHLLGEVLGRQGTKALALVRLDRLAEFGAPKGIHIYKPMWMGL